MDGSITSREHLAVSLRNALAVAFAGSALVLTILVSLLVGWLASDHVRSRVINEFQFIASEMRDKLDRALLERLSDIKLLTTAPVIINGEAPQDRRRERLEDFRRAAPDHAWIGLADSTGKLVASTDRILEGTDVSHWPWFQGGLKGPFISDSGQSLSGEHQTVVDLAAPVLTSDRQLSGVIVSNLSWDWAEAMSRELVASSNEAIEILLVAQNGRVLLGPQRGATFNIPNVLMAPPGARAAAMEADDYLIAVAASRGYREYPSLGWRVVVRERTREALQPVADLQRQVLLWGTCIGLTTALLGMLMANSITRPLRAIVAAAGRLQTGGTTSLEAPRSYIREVNVLSQSLRTLFEQREGARQAAEAAGSARANFLAAMSHEIRTPMTGVLGMADLLAAEDLTSKQKGYVSAIQSSGKHLLHIINDILDFSRIETGKIQLEHIDFSVPELLERVRSMVQPMAIERGLTFEVHIAEHSPPILKGDPTRLNQVLLNLAGNAIKFTRKGSVTIDVTHQPLEQNQAKFRFEVRDTGIGIAAETQAELFTAFTQADRSTARQYGGSGLGLAISKRLVEAMGGEIGVSSLVGLGSVFWFEIPFELGDIVEAPKADQVRLTAEQPRRILVAEDVEINQQILQNVLSTQGHHVTFANNGAEALALVQREPFDLILMDVQMPIMDGVTATRQIRKVDGPAHDIPVLALTANVMAQERERYLAAGMNECLMKPINWQELAAAIARYPVRAIKAPPIQRADEAATVDAAPLFRRALLDELGAGVLPLVKRALEDAEAACERIAALPPDSPELEREAHRLKGMSGSLGMMAISREAARLDDATRMGAATAPLVTCLREVTTATRVELQNEGLI